ncbi:MAG TPA: DUF2950 domain-containing protein [Elusimicrobiota bacterium]|nr:DUF2950 domain-containing protein [Elusimicrobiota bacterium]
MIGIACSTTPRASANDAPGAQRTFASPQDAIQALFGAVRAHDKAALRDIFGPEVQGLLPGDEALSKANSEGFAEAMMEGAKPVSEGADRIILEIGSNEWPFPVPLVKENSAWRFDTAAGKDELLNRHIGKDELHAIGVCEAYVRAQKQRAGDSPGAAPYARKFRSTPGKMDGLYWETAPGGAPSPFSEAVVEAAVDAGGAPAKPFHGYFFRILTRQGAAAPGGRMNYVKDGSLSRGFALEAYPRHWGRSGIMTFIVDQDGKIYQRDLGKRTPRAAAAMKEYNPDGDWTPVKDRGVLEK